MDILQKELKTFYESRQLHKEQLDTSKVQYFRDKIGFMAAVNNACYVITDAHADTCFVDAGSFARILGITSDSVFHKCYNSGDEDVIYNRIHPEDLVEKRMLEYDFFRYIDRMPATDKLHHTACCRFRIRNCKNEYFYVSNTTRILSLSPNGKVWLILCSYMLSPNQTPSSDIEPRIINNITGQIQPLQLSLRRNSVLTDREKQVLRLIQSGKLSKEISDILQISVNTVNRHRQDILQKLSDNNSIEAVNAAREMRLM